MKTFGKVILCLSVMAPRGIVHSQISDFWRGCRLSKVSVSRRVLSLYNNYINYSLYNYNNNLLHLYCAFLGTQSAFHRNGGISSSTTSANISVLNLMQAATGSQCKEIKRGVARVILGSLKTSRCILNHL